MDLHLQSTIFGQIVRIVSRNGKLKYPDEIDPSLWKGALQGDPSQEPHQSQQSCERQHPDGQTDGPEKGMQTYGAQSGDIERSGQLISPTANPSDVVVVGWYGPDDPEASDFTASNVTYCFVPMTNSLECRTESTELA
jgi:DHA1 family multidrug resistance protein-like MFS transporter